MSDVDRSDVADAARFRWLLRGNGYFLEEEMLCGHETDCADRDEARRRIDAEMREEEMDPKQ